MTPPLRRGEFVLITTAEGRHVKAMVGLASENGVSIALHFDAMLGGWLGFMAASEQEDGDFEALDGMRVRVRREWDHNGECLVCDEQGEHDEACPWRRDAEA